MSGGHFDYAQYKIGLIADSVEQLIRNNNDLTPNDWGEPRGHQFSDETVAEFKRAMHYLELAQIYAQRIDWLVSGDDGELTFHQRLREDIEQMKKYE